MRKANTKLVDQQATSRRNRRSIPVQIQMSDAYIEIAPEGYGEKTATEGHGSPIIIEVHEGKLRLVVYGDINREEPTDVISLEGARETARLTKPPG